MEGRVRIAPGSSPKFLIPVEGRGRINEEPIMNFVNNLDQSDHIGRGNPYNKGYNRRPSVTKALRHGRWDIRGKPIIAGDVRSKKIRSGQISR